MNCGIQNRTEALVFRQVAFPLSAFDYLKEFQREYESRHGVRLNNDQTLALILAEHRQITEGSGEQQNECSKFER